MTGAPAAGAGAPAQGQASPRVTNFAQGMAADGAAMKGMGAGMGPMMGPISMDSGWDMNRAFKHTSNVIAAGRQDAGDLVAASIAESGNDTETKE